MPKVMSLYLDDSGTRNPDRKLPQQFMFRDWFTLGGYVTKEEDEGTIETAHATFCDQWGITYPLHSYDIRSETKDFTWLSGLSGAMSFCRSSRSLFVGRRDDLGDGELYRLSVAARATPPIVPFRRFRPKFNP
jgi:hypothetical protein